MNYNPEFSYDAATPIELVDELIRRSEEGGALYEGDQPELSSIAQRFSEAIQKSKMNYVDVSEINDAIKLFFKRILLERDLDQSRINSLPLVEAAYIELCALGRVVGRLREAETLPDDLVYVLNLPRNATLKGALLAVSEDNASNVRELQERTSVPGRDTPMSRQHARNLALRLSQYGLIEIVRLQSDAPNTALVFKASSLGKNVAYRITPSEMWVPAKVIHLRDWLKTQSPSDDETNDCHEHLKKCDSV